MASSHNRFDSLHAVASLVLASIGSILVIVDYFLVYVNILVYFFYAYLAYCYSNIGRKQLFLKEYVALISMISFMMIFSIFIIRNGHFNVASYADLRLAFFVMVLNYLLAPFVASLARDAVSRIRG